MHKHDENCVFCRIAGNGKPKVDMRKVLLEYFANPKAELNDLKGMHALADKLGVEHGALEEQAYRLLHDFLGAGLYVQGGSKAKIDPKELAMGIKVEMEHTKSKDLSERIAKDHLTEIPDYYTRLKKMESEAEA